MPLEDNYAPGELHRLISRVQTDLSAFRSESQQGIEMLRREAKEERHAQANRLTEFLAKIIRLEARVDAFDRGMVSLQHDNEKMDGRIEGLTQVISTMGRKVDALWNRAIAAGMVLGFVGWVTTQALTFWSAHR